MTHEQGKEVISMIIGAYPNFIKGEDEVIKARMRLWKGRLREWDYEKTVTLLNDYIDNNVFPPTIADIKPFIREHDSISKKLNEVYR